MDEFHIKGPGEGYQLTHYHLFIQILVRCFSAKCPRVL